MSEKMVRKGEFSKRPITVNRKTSPTACGWRIVKDKQRLFEGTGEILLADGSVTVEGTGKYLILPLEKIADFDAEAQEWKVVPWDGDPEEVEI